MLQSINITNDKRFKQLAFQYYNNPCCVNFEEFESDIRIFGTVASTLNKYATKSGTISERLLLNRIIIAHNLFGQFAVDGLFWKVDKNYWTILKTYLDFLKLIPEYSQYNDIECDEELMKILQSL